jgi:hypothetical protein
MEFLFSKSDTFTYVKQDTENLLDEDDKAYAEKIRKFEALTKPDFKRMFITCNYGISSGSENQVYVLNLKSGTLKSYIKNKKDITKWNYPECVENIGFYKNGRCVFESCSHEELYRFYTENKQDVDFLIKIGVNVTDKYDITETDIPVL